MAELFKWVPHFHEENTNTDEWSSIVSKYENHTTQRRAKWSRRYGRWKFLFSREVATSTTDAIMDFFNARQGRAQSFYLPSWKNEFQLATSHIAPFTNGNISLISTSSIAARLTSVAGQRGNFIHISNGDWASPTGDVFQITNITSNVLTVNRVAGSNSSYTTGSFVNICYLVYFTNDVLSQDNLLPTLFKTGLEFEEI